MNRNKIKVQASSLLCIGTTCKFFLFWYKKIHEIVNYPSLEQDVAIFQSYCWTLMDLNGNYY